MGKVKWNKKINKKHGWGKKKVLRKKQDINPRYSYIEVYFT